MCVNDVLSITHNWMMLSDMWMSIHFNYAIATCGERIFSFDNERIG